MSEFTKGKWEIDEDLKYSINTGKKHIAMVNHYNSPNPELCVWGEESLANARLIAAAPELYEACKKALSSIKALKRHSTTAWSLLEQKLEAALAKAEEKQ